MENVIEVKNLTKEYKNLKAIDNLSFEVKKGEILGLLGPNGSGKTTTINSVLSLIKANGQIKIFGKEMSPDAYDIKRKIGVVFQEIAVFSELTVYENIDYFCSLYITDKNKRKEYVNDAIKLVGLENYKKFYPKQLSGGLLRRLNIACGISHKPELIFLDEPTVAVDPQSRNNILEGIKKLRDDGASIVYTTHYMEEVEILCDRIIILDKGKILAEGTSDELKKRANIEEKITVEIDEINNKIIEEIKKFKTVHNISLNEKVLVITYKKGKNNLGELIDFLKENNVKGTFFITGHYLNTKPELVQKMIESGNTVGNHTVNHKSMPEIDLNKIKEEVMNLHTAVYEKFGYEMKYIRPPKGECSERTISYTNSLGYTTVMWSLAYDDWDENKQGRESYGKEKVLNNLHNGAIILLHSNSKDNANILDEIIKKAKEMGYEFKSLDEFEK